MSGRGASPALPLYNIIRPHAPLSAETLVYDHCKAPAEPQGPGWVVPSMLVAAARDAAAAGAVAPLAPLARQRTFAYRGSLDRVYLDGAVNKTVDVFAAFAADARAQIKFVTSVASGHCTPTIDPAVPTSSCGNGKGGPPAVENCGYDGAGEALQHLYEGALKTPPSPGCDSACAARVMSFNQTAYEPGGGRPTWLGATGFALIPPACAKGSPCRLHIALHGCGMSTNSKAMNLSYVLHAGFSSWGLENDIVVLYPQGGVDVNAPTGQMRSGCFDSYGHTGADYAYKSGTQMSTVRNLIHAVAGW